jgi:hypothetical protein
VVGAVVHAQQIELVQPDERVARDAVGVHDRHLQRDCKR